MEEVEKREEGLRRGRFINPENPVKVLKCEKRPVLTAKTGRPRSF